MKTYMMLLAMLFAGLAFTQSDLTAKEIVEKADQKLRGESSYAEVKMTIVRPTWTREVTMKSWSLGNKYSLILITAPPRDKGAAFLKRGNEIWNWQPTIDRTIKMPPSMMSQSWMGSDFTNDDLVRESSTVTDYDHKKIGSETINGRECYKLELTPKEGAPVVWGKVLLWIDKKEFMQMKVEFYDEDDFLVNTMYGKNVKTLGGKILPGTMEVIPADKPEQKTVLEYLELQFDIKVNEGFFSIANMKKIK